MKKLIKKYYNVTFAVLAVVSIILIIMDYAGMIDLNQMPYVIIDNGILVVFAIDYFGRLFSSTNRWYFFTHNLIDLLAIIPFSSFFSLFRFARLFRLVRLTRILRLARLAGVINMLNGKASKFLHSGGLIYYLWLSTILILLGAAIYSLAEKASYGNSIWWAIVTATTVGYGDISPTTTLGRIAAVILMFNGIGLIGALTGAITSYLAGENGDASVSKADEIRKFKALEEDGIITKSEFQFEKNKLLGIPSDTGSSDTNNSGNVSDQVIQK